MYMTYDVTFPRFLISNLYPSDCYHIQIASLLLLFWCIKMTVSTNAFSLGILDEPTIAVTRSCVTKRTSVSVFEPFNARQFFKNIRQ